MRDYSIVSGRFWIGDTGKELRDDRDAQVLALYLITSPHSSMTGLYYCPIMYIAQDTGLAIGAVTDAMARLCDMGFCVYDHDTETVFVLEMARFQVAEELAPKDNRRTAVVRELERIVSPLVPLFIAKYRDAYHLHGVRPKAYRWRPKISTMRELIKRSGNQCARCGATEDLEVDTVVAKILGGSDDVTNLQFLCVACHPEKIAADVAAFWQTVDPIPLEKGQVPPLEKGHVPPLGSQDQDQDQGSGSGSGKRGGEVRRDPPSLPLGDPGPPPPPPGASDRLRAIYHAMQTVQFTVPGAGEQTMWENIGNKRGVGLAAKLDDSCPNVDVAALVNKLAGWTYANPRKAKRDLGRFIWNAAVRDQDKPARRSDDDQYRHGTDLEERVRSTRRGKGGVR